MAPTALLDLPDEILEIVIDKLIRSLGGTDVYEVPTIANAQPVFPGRPYGATDLVSLRQTCRRLQKLVDACSMQSIAVYLCADHVRTSKFRGVRRRGLHPLCGTANDGPASALNPAPGWHILQAASTAKSKVKDVTFTLCYASSGNRVDEKRVKRVQGAFSRALEALSPTIQSLQLKISQQFEYVDLDFALDDFDLRQEIVVHCGITTPFNLPALRSLRLDDASLYNFLPLLALEAPLLEIVVLGEWTRRWGSANLQKHVTAIADAVSKQALRIPASGAWKELILESPARDLGQYSALFRHLDIVADKLVFGHRGYDYMEDVVQVHPGQSDEEDSWRDAVVDIAGDALVNGQFAAVAFRVVNCATYDIFDDDEGSAKERNTISDAIAKRLEEKGAKAVPIVWEGY